MNFPVLFQSLIVFSNTKRKKNRKYRSLEFQSLIVFSNTYDEKKSIVALSMFQSLIVFSNTTNTSVTRLDD